MIAQVVPVTRLRRATDWWSYKVPGSFVCQPGCLVVIPFRGRPTLGVVWALQKEDDKARDTISQVLTAQPVVLAPHRRFIEWLAESGICSLSTVLHQWLPASLRQWPFTGPVLRLVQEYFAKPFPPDTPAQQLVLIPSTRSALAATLQERAGERFSLLLGEQTDKEELQEWLKIAGGLATLGLGRERALFAPWRNLQNIAVADPEDISYSHEQIPYLNLVEAAQALAEPFQAVTHLRSKIPQRAAEKIWGKSAQGLTEPLPRLHFTDLRQERLINADLINALKEVLAAGQQVIILYNANDRVLERDGERILLPGVQTLRKQLAVALGYSELPTGIKLGTRSILGESLEEVGLTVVLSLDPLLHQTGLGDQVHGWGDLGHLFSYQVPCRIQTHDLSHPLVRALQNKQWERYCLEVLEEHATHGLAPFAETIVCSIPINKSAKPTPDKAFEQLQTVAGDWAVSHPFTSRQRGRESINLLLHAPLGTRLPFPLRKILAALPRPWKVQHNPWFTL